MFLQGCAGDIRPNLPGEPYRCGDEADIKWTGRSLGCAVVRATDRSVVREELAKRKTIYSLKCASSVIQLPGKKEKLACEMQAQVGRAADKHLRVLGLQARLTLGVCRALGRACVEAGNGLSLGAMHSHALRHGAQWQRRISPFPASTRRAGAIFGAIRRCRLVVGGNPTPRRRLG